MIIKLGIIGAGWIADKMGETLADPEVNLVYIATPHSHHFIHSKMAVEAGKAVLCEKAFTANAREAEELISLAESRGV